jgi:hypothetical protein
VWAATARDRETADVAGEEPVAPRGGEPTAAGGGEPAVTKGEPAATEGGEPAVAGPRQSSGQKRQGREGDAWKMRRAGGRACPEGVGQERRMSAA